MGKQSLHKRDVEGAEALGTPTGCFPRVIAPHHTANPTLELPCRFPAHTLGVIRNSAGAYKRLMTRLLMWAIYM